MVNLFTTWHNATLNTLALFGERITRWRIAQAWIGIWNPCAKTPKMAAPECMMFDTAGSVLSQETLSLEPHKVNRLLFLAQYLGKQPGRLLAKSARPHVGLGAPSSPHLGLIFMLFAEYNIVLLCLSPACNVMSYLIFAKYLFGEHFTCMIQSWAWFCTVWVSVQSTLRQPLSRQSLDVSTLCTKRLCKHIQYWYSIDTPLWAIQSCTQIGPEEAHINFVPEDLCLYIFNYGWDFCRFRLGHNIVVFTAYDSNREVDLTENYAVMLLMTKKHTNKEWSWKYWQQRDNMSPHLYHTTLASWVFVCSPFNHNLETYALTKWTRELHTDYG